MLPFLPQNHQVELQVERSVKELLKQTPTLETPFQMALIQAKLPTQVPILNARLQLLSGAPLILHATNAQTLLLPTILNLTTAKYAHKIRLGLHQPNAAKNSLSHVPLANHTIQQHKNVKLRLTVELTKSTTQLLAHAKHSVHLVKSACVLQNLLSGTQKPYIVKNVINQLHSLIAL